MEEFTSNIEYRQIHSYIVKRNPRTGPEVAGRLKLPHFMTIGTRRW